MIVVGTITNSGGQTNKDDYSFSHNVAAGTSLLVVVIGCADAGGKNTIAGVTYNGDALTSGRQKLDGGDLEGASIWYRVNPDVGNNTVAIDCDDTTNGSNAWAISLSGIDAASPVNTQNDATANGNPSCAVTTTKANTIIFDCFASQRTSNLAADASQTSIGQNQLAGDANHTVGASYKIVSTSAEHTMSWTGSAVYAQVVVAFSGSKRSKAIIIS